MTTPDRLDLGAVRVPGGYFVTTDANRVPYHAEPSDSGEYRHCYTYERSPESIEEAALELIRGATDKIFVASFRIGDEHLQQALYEAADRLRGGVYVITEIGDRSLRQGLAAITEDDDVSDDVAAQNKQFADLTSRGIYVRGHESCHAKFIVVDDRVALISSANLESRALHITGENGVVITEPGQVGRLARFFTRLWYAGCTWDVPPGTDYQSATRRPTAVPCRVPIPEIIPEPGVIWTHEDEHLIHQTVLDVIARARAELVLATFSMVGLTDRPEVLCEPLDRAVRAGVRVRILVRSRNNIAGHRRDAATLHALGAQVHADSQTHAKGVIADRRHGALFSANFDVQHGLFSGVETGTRLDGLPALSDAADFFDHAIAHADMRFVVDPEQRELDRWLRAPWLTRWPLGAEIAVSATEEAWARLHHTAADQPILYSWDRRGPVQLLSHTDCWELTERGSGRYELRSPRTAEPDNSRAGLDELLTSRPGRSRTAPASERDRGFCAAVLVRLAD